MSIDVSIVQSDIANLDLCGKTITHERFGKGIVIGYSSISGEPFIFFYKLQDTEHPIICVDHSKVIFV